jgi:TPR repeat protein
VGVFKGSPLVNSTAASFSCLHKHGFQLFEDADREDLAPHNHFPGPTVSRQLGLMYATGEGVPQNNLRAYVWWSVAAAQGNEDARGNRDRMADRLTPEQLARGQDMATRCFESDYQDCE